MPRVLVVEDSPVARRLLVELLSRDPDVEVVGEATHGSQAVAEAARLEPDVVTMDVALPEMDGLEATRRIMREHPRPIVVVSAAYGRDAKLAIRALEAGALAVMPKPQGPGSPNFERRAAELVDCVKAMSEVRVVRRRQGLRPASIAMTPPAPRPAAPADLVAIAASTGGPAALGAILRAMPAEAPAPILVVQHIAPGFEEGLSRWLDGLSPLRVRVAEDGMPVMPGDVALAPARRHMGISADGRVRLSAGPPIDGHRPSASHLFASVASTYAGRALGVVLTGMGSDGVSGLLALRRAGGAVVAQDRDSCTVYGMPGAATAAGAVSRTVGLEHMATAIMAACGGSRSMESSLARRGR